MSAPPPVETLRDRIAHGRGATRQRPEPGAIEPVRPGERSVWRFPRPPRVLRIVGVVEVRLGDAVVARSERALQVIETASPPVPYFPLADVKAELVDRDDWALCEWKGISRFFDLRLGGRTVARAGWRYTDPLSDLGEPYPLLKDHAAFLPAGFDAFWNGERVRWQEGGYYGGWITAVLKGPFKGAPGTQGC